MTAGFTKCSSSEESATSATVSPSFLSLIHIFTTGQAKNSDVAKKIEQGLVGGLFNLKGVAKIRDVQKLAVENSRLGIPLLLSLIHI